MTGPAWNVWHLHDCRGLWPRQAQVSMGMRTVAVWPAHPGLPPLKTDPHVWKFFPAAGRLPSGPDLPDRSHDRHSRPPAHSQLGELGVPLHTPIGCALQWGRAAHADTERETELETLSRWVGRPTMAIITFKWIKGCHEILEEEPFQAGGAWARGEKKGVCEISGGSRETHLGKAWLCTLERIFLEHLTEDPFQTSQKDCHGRLEGKYKLSFICIHYAEWILFWIAGIGNLMFLALVGRDIISPYF